MIETESVIFETALIRSLFNLVAAVGSGRTMAEILEANVKGETVDIDFDLMTDHRFFAVLALIATEHALVFDKTKSEIKEMLNDSLDSAFAATASMAFMHA